MPDPNQIPIIGPFYRATTDIQRDQIPILGDVWRGTNAVIDFVEYGCFPTWTVWLETLYPVAGQTILQLLDFGVGDILRGYFRPSSTRGLSGLTRKPGRKRPLKASRLARARNSAQLPEVGNSIGKRLPGGTFFQSRKVTGVEARLWQLDMATQRALWYWLVADISADFAVNWTTAIMQSEACLDHGHGTIVATNADGGAAFPNLWTGLLGWQVETEIPPGIFNSTTGQITPPPGWTTTIALTGRADGVSGTTPTAGQLQAQDGTDITTWGIRSPIPVTPPDEQTLPVMFGTVEPNHVIGLFGKAQNSTFYHWRDLKLTATLTPP